MSALNSLMQKRNSLMYHSKSGRRYLTHKTWSSSIVRSAMTTRGTRRCLTLYSHPERAMSKSIHRLTRVQLVWAHRVSKESTRTLTVQLVTKLAPKQSLKLELLAKSSFKARLIEPRRVTRLEQPRCWIGKDMRHSSMA